MTMANGRHKTRLTISVIDVHDGRHVKFLRTWVAADPPHTMQTGGSPLATVSRRSR